MSKRLILIQKNTIRLLFLESVAYFKCEIFDQNKNCTMISASKNHIKIYKV